MDSSSNAANDVEAMSIKEMKALITKAGLTHTDCFEKSDLRQRAREALAKTASAETQLSESSDEIEDSDDDAPPTKRAKQDDSKPHVYALLISTGQTSLEDTSIVGLYKTWADAIKKAKHVLAWGESGKGGEFWNPVENDGMIPLGGDIDDEYGENLEDYNDKTDKYRAEPKRSTDGIEVASATNGQGDYGNMSMCIQKVALP